MVSCKAELTPIGLTVFLPFSLPSFLLSCHPTRRAPGLSVVDTHTYSVVLSVCISSGMLWWKWLYGGVSPSLLVHVEQVGFRTLLSLDSDPHGSAVGTALLGLDMCFFTAVKVVRCLQSPQGVWPQLSAWSWLLSLRIRICRERKVSEEERIYFLWSYFLESQSFSLAFSCLSWMTFVPAAPKGSHFGEMSQASAQMMVLHPSLLSLLPPFHPQVPFLFWKDTTLKFKCGGIKVITFSLQVSLSESLQIISG